MNPPWSTMVRIVEVPITGHAVVLDAGEPERERIAKNLDLLALEALEAQVMIKPWFDGAQVSATWTARIAQSCGVTLERLDQDLAGDFLVHVVPLGSLHVPDLSTISDLDPEAMDPPDVADDGQIDLAAYVVEHLALEIDPFPRKPGIQFTPPEPDPDFSPFAVLKRLHKED